MLTDCWITGLMVLTFLFSRTSRKRNIPSNEIIGREKILKIRFHRKRSVGDRFGLRASGVPDRKLDFANAPTLSSVVCRILEYCGRNINFMEHRAAANHLHIILWLRKIDTVDR